MESIEESEPSENEIIGPHHWEENKTPGTITRIYQEKSARELLSRMGETIFRGERLDRFINDNLNSLSSSEEIDSTYLRNQERNSKLFGLLNAEGGFLGGLIIKFYLWEKLKDQLYFFPRISQDEVIEGISVRTISSLVEKTLKPSQDIKLGIYLSFFAVKDGFRKKGLGRVLFQKFIQEVEENPDRGKLAFTIILGKHSLLPIGEALMRDLLGKEPRRSSEFFYFEHLKEKFHLPDDLFQTDSRSLATKNLVKEWRFSFLGYSKFLGELWGKIY